MNKLTQSITFDHYSADAEAAVHITFCGLNDEEITLELNENQYSLIKFRADRSFYIRCGKEKILQEIDDAVDVTALEYIVKRYYLGDACCFNGINFYGAKHILKAVVEALYKYPKLRSKLCFIGTHYEFEKLIIRLQQGDRDVLDAFNLQYICTKENAIQLGNMLHGILTRIIDDHENYVATAMCAFGLFDALLFDKNNYEDNAYSEFTEQLNSAEEDGFHPKGCSSPESVVYHELGHLLDDMCGLSETAEFKSLYKNLTEEDIKYGLSEYACTSATELIAEAFAEYMCSAQPRPIAKKIGGLLDKAYLLGSPNKE